MSFVEGYQIGLQLLRQAESQRVQEEQLGLAREREKRLAASELQNQAYRAELLQNQRESLKSLDAFRKAQAEGMREIPLNSIFSVEQLSKSGINPMTVVPMDRIGQLLAPMLREPNAPAPSSDIKNYEYYAQQERAGGREPLGFDAWLTSDANRRAPRTTIINEGEKLLTPSEAGQLGVPYGTTREGAAGKIPHKPMTDLQIQTTETGISTLDAALGIMDKIRPDLNKYSKYSSGVHFQAAVNALRKSAESGVFGTAVNAAVIRSLPADQRKLLGNWASAQEHIQRMRAVMQGAAGFRSREAFETLLNQLGSTAATPETTRETFENSYKTLREYRDVLKKSLVRNQVEPQGGSEGGMTIKFSDGSEMTID